MNIQRAANIRLPEMQGASIPRRNSRRVASIRNEWRNRRLAPAAFTGSGRPARTARLRRRLRGGPVFRARVVRHAGAGANGRPGVTFEEIAAGIEAHIAAESETGGGCFRLQHEGRGLSIELVRVHMEYLSHLGDGVSFACMDLVGTDGPVYDVDFFMKGPPGSMTVTETTVHKVDGNPLYAWAQRRVPRGRSPASRRARRRGRSW